MKQTNTLHPLVPSSSRQEHVEIADEKNSWGRIALPLWVLLPLRAFLGATFVYAGLQKLTDPQFFDPKAVDFIGKQIQRFATGSPIRGFLVQVAVPHAVLFGGLVAYGELAIGIGVLTGILLRPAAFFGAFINLIFFLTASWNVHPYFYGSDIVFLFAWIPLVLAGATGNGWPEYDRTIAIWLMRHVPLQRREQFVRALAFVLGVNALDLAPAGDAEQAVSRTVHVRGTTTGRRNRPGRGVARASARTTRREFIRGAASGVVGTLVVMFVGSLFKGNNGGSGTGTTGSTGTTSTGGATAAGSSATSSGGPTTIAEVSQVPANSAASFTVPGSGDPGVLVHLPDGKFVAYDAVCTHNGCTVQYDPSSHMLICPCHGAEFDPTHSASVVAGPAPAPLTPVSVSVNSSTGAITAS